MKIDKHDPQLLIPESFLQSEKNLLIKRNPSGIHWVERSNGYTIVTCRGMSLPVTFSTIIRKVHWLMKADK